MSAISLTSLGRKAPCVPRSSRLMVPALTRRPPQKPEAHPRVRGAGTAFPPQIRQTQARPVSPVSGRRPAKCTCPRQSPGTAVALGGRTAHPRLPQPGGRTQGTARRAGTWPGRWKADSSTPRGSSHHTGVTAWPPTASEVPADPGGRTLTVETPFLHVTGGEVRFSQTQSKPLVCVLRGLGSA